MMSVQPNRPACALYTALALVLSVAGSACSRAPSGPTGPRVYVTNEASGDISIIDPETRSVVTTVRVGKRPRGIKVSPDGRSLFVALSGSPSAPPGVDERTLPPPDRSADGIGELDTATNRLVRIIHAGEDPEQLDVSADGARLFVANEDAAQVSVVDLKAGTVVATAKVGAEPEGVSIRPDGRVVYVTSEEDGEVAAIDTTTYAVLKKIPVGDRPWGIALLNK